MLVTTITDQSSRQLGVQTTVTTTSKIGHNGVVGPSSNTFYHIDMFRTLAANNESTVANALVIWYATLKACQPDGDNPTLFRFFAPRLPGFWLSPSYAPEDYNDILYLIRARFESLLGIRPAAGDALLMALAKL